jgi:outer membrane protein assembly factor BamB
MSDGVTNRLAAMALVGVLAACWAQVAAGDWPGFRGPGGIGISDEKNLPLAWAPDSNILWKVDVPGDDTVTSSPCVVGKNVYITYAVKKPVEHHVLCLNAETGAKFWDTPVEPGTVKSSDGRAGFATPTPCADKDGVYVAFGSGVVAGIDPAGKPLWRTEFKDPAFDVAMGVSPILFEGTVILLCDRSNGKPSIIGYDKKAGTIKWEQARKGVGFGHSTPALVKVKDKPMLLIAANKQAQGVDPADGKLLWWASADGDVSSPAFGGDLMYCDGGRGGPGTVIDVTGAGDVTKTNVKWSAKLGVGECFASPLIVGEYVYRLNGAKLLCLKAADGTKAYEKELAGITSACCPFATADGRIYVASAGKSYVVKAGPDFEILGTNDLKDAANPSPAVADGKIYLRGKKCLWCIGNKPVGK